MQLLPHLPHLDTDKHFAGISRFNTARPTWQLIGKKVSISIPHVSKEIFVNLHN